MAVIAFIVVLLFLIIIHELGHFFTALLFRVNVQEFGIGIPPKVGTLFTFKGVPFTLNALPFGGFVRMEGEGDDASITKVPGKVSLNDLSIPKKLVIILAGAAVNFLFGILAFTIIFSILGIPVRGLYPTITAVSENSPAATAGLQAEDQLVSVATDLHAKKSITDTEQFIALIKENKGKQVSIEIERGGQRQTINLTVRTDDQIPTGEGALGIALGQETLQKFPWYQMPFRAASVGLSQSVQFSSLILRSLGTMGSDLFTRGSVPQDVAGPVGIAYQVQKQNLFASGPLAILNFAAMLSVNLAIMNVLPIPALDGGRAVFILIEKLFPKNKRSQIEQAFNSIGFTFLIGLLCLITFKDIWQIIRP